MAFDVTATEPAPLMDVQVDAETWYAAAMIKEVHGEAVRMPLLHPEGGLLVDLPSAGLTILAHGANVDEAVRALQQVLPETWRKQLNLQRITSQEAH